MENCELYKTAILFIVGWTNDMLLYYLVCSREPTRPSKRACLLESSHESQPSTARL